MRAWLLRGTALALALGTLGVAAPARAEVIELIDKSKLAGKVIHFYDGVFSIETATGVVKLPREKVKSITYELPKPRAELATPEKTFERWKKALGDGNIEAIIDCYALIYQGMLASQVGQAGDAVKKMQKELEGTKFTVKGSSQKGDTATLKVQRQKDDSSETGEIAFVRENGEWKMLPPQ